MTYHTSRHHTPEMMDTEDKYLILAERIADLLTARVCQFNSAESHLDEPGPGRQHPPEASFWEIWPNKEDEDRTTRHFNRQKMDEADSDHNGDETMDVFMQNKLLKHNMLKEIAFLDELQWYDRTATHPKARITSKHIYDRVSWYETQYTKDRQYTTNGVEWYEIEWKHIRPFRTKTEWYHLSIKREQKLNLFLSQPFIQRRIREGYIKYLFRRAGIFRMSFYDPGPESLHFPYGLRWSINRHSYLRQIRDRVQFVHSQLKREIMNIQALHHIRHQLQPYGEGLPVTPGLSLLLTLLHVFNYPFETPRFRLIP